MTLQYTTISIPFDFVLDEISMLNPVIGRMFGCYSIYVGNKIVLIHRDSKTSQEDNGVWIATTKDHHDSLIRELPSMRSIAVFGTGPTGWQVIPSESDTFEEEVRHVCAMVRRGDPRIGKIPKPKKPKRPADSNKKASSKSPKMSPKAAKPRPIRKKARKVLSAVRKKKV